MSAKQDKKAPATTSGQDANSEENAVDHEAVAAVLTEQMERLAGGLVARNIAVSGDQHDPVGLALGEIDRLGEELRSAKASITAQKGHATRARNELEVVEAKLPPKPRKYPAFPDRREISTAELIEAIDDAGGAELVFLDENAREILGLVPRTIAASAFTKGRFDRLLCSPAELVARGPEVGDPYRLAGYAIEVGGECLTHGRRADCPLVIGAGMAFELKGDIAF